jgi:pilus assembly protein CpaB
VRFLTPAMMTIILLLVVAGLVVAYVVKSLFAVEPQAAAPPRLYPMAVADLEPGTQITASHLAQGPYTGESKRTFARADTILIGRVVREKITAAQPIDTTKLYAPGEMAPIQVAEGMRATSLSLADGAAVVDGLVKPGVYVDVHFTPSGMEDRRFRGGLTMTMFKGVKVLAMNRMRIMAQSRGTNTVTLELSPEQANIILLAKDKGRLDLTYTPDGLGNGGVALADEDKAYLEEILGLAPTPEPKKPFITEYYRRGGRGAMAFNDDGTPFSGTDNGNGGWNGDGRTPPHQFGGYEPTGSDWGSYFRGIDNKTSPNAPQGAGAQPNAGQNTGNGSGMRLIPSPSSRPNGVPAGPGV